MEGTTEPVANDRASYYALDDAGKDALFSDTPWLGGASFYPLRTTVESIQEYLFPAESTRSVVSIGSGCCLLEWLLAEHDRCIGIHCIENTSNRAEFPNSLPDCIRLESKLSFAVESSDLSEDAQNRLNAANILLLCEPDCAGFNTYLTQFRNGAAEGKLVVLVKNVGSKVNPTPDMLSGILTLIAERTFEAVNFLGDSRDISIHVYRTEGLMRVLEEARSQRQHKK